VDEQWCLGEWGIIFSFFFVPFVLEELSTLNSVGLMMVKTFSNPSFHFVIKLCFYSITFSYCCDLKWKRMTCKIYFWGVGEEYLSLATHDLDLCLLSVTYLLCIFGLSASSALMRSSLK
jgi:hypothetical protein